MILGHRPTIRISKKFLIGSYLPPSDRRLRSFKQLDGLRYLIYLIYTMLIFLFKKQWQGADALETGWVKSDGRSGAGRT